MFNFGATLLWLVDILLILISDHLQPFLHLVTLESGYDRNNQWLSLSYDCQTTDFLKPGPPVLP